MSSTMDLIFLLAVLTIAIVEPFLGRREKRRLERELAAGQSSARSRAFAKTIKLQWIATGLLVVVWLFTTYRYETVFLVPGWSGWEWLTVVIGLLVAGLMVAQTLFLRGRTEQLAKIRGQLGAVALLAPRTRHEQRLFDALSVTAGICEELVYRGFLLGALAALIGLWPAFAVSTILFGLAHAYQGVRGVLRTGIFGGIAALLTVFSGSIYLAVVVHAIVDLSQGRMIAMAVRGETSEAS